MVFIVIKSCAAIFTIFACLYIALFQAIGHVCEECGIILTGELFTLHGRVLCEEDFKVWMVMIVLLLMVIFVWRVMIVLLLMIIFVWMVMIVLLMMIIFVWMVMIVLLLVIIFVWMAMIVLLMLFIFVWMVMIVLLMVMMTGL